MDVICSLFYIHPHLVKSMRWEIWLRMKDMFNGFQRFSSARTAIINYLFVDICKFYYKTSMGLAS